MKTTIILGTGREGRQSEKVADFVKRSFEESGKEFSFIDVKDFPQNFTQEKPEEWKKIASESEAFVIVSPEYNHGFPGELKMLLDCAYEEYRYKPVLLCGVSAGGFGGARVCDAMTLYTNIIGMHPLQTHLNFSSVNDLDFSDEETYKAHLKKINPLIDELVKVSESLSSLR